MSTSVSPWVPDRIDSKLRNMQSPCMLWLRLEGLTSDDIIKAGGVFRPGMGFPDSDGFGRGSDSGGFERIPSSPQEIFWRYFTVCMGILTPLQKCIPDSDGFGRGSDSGGFGWIPRPQNWNQPLQVETKHPADVECPPPPRRVCMSIHPEGKKPCSDLALSTCFP